MALAPDIYFELINPTRSDSSSPRGLSLKEEFMRGYRRAEPKFDLRTGRSWESTYGGARSPWENFPQLPGERRYLTALIYGTVVGPADKLTGMIQDMLQSPYPGTEESLRLSYAPGSIVEMFRVANIAEAEPVMEMVGGLAEDITRWGYLWMDEQKGNLEAANRMLDSFAQALRRPDEARRFLGKRVLEHKPSFYRVLEVIDGGLSGLEDLALEQTRIRGLNSVLHEHGTFDHIASVGKGGRASAAYFTGMGEGYLTLDPEDPENRAAARDLFRNAKLSDQAIEEIAAAHKTIIY